MKQRQSAFNIEHRKAKYFLTPPDLMEKVIAELGESFFDPCPYPRPDGYNSLLLNWHERNYINPPFHREDGDGEGPTAFARKAIVESRRGNKCVLVLPVQSYVNLLLEAGAIMKSVGRVRWIDGESGMACTSPSPIAMFILGR